MRVNHYIYWLVIVHNEYNATGGVQLTLDFAGHSSAIFFMKALVYSQSVGLHHHNQHDQPSRNCQLRRVVFDLANSLNVSFKLYNILRGHLVPQ